MENKADLKLIPDPLSHDDLKIAVLISGRGSNLKALIEACAEENFPGKIVAVITNNKEAVGLQYAEKAGIPYYFIDYKKFPDRQAFDMAINAELLAGGVNFICLAGFMKVLTKDFVEKWHNKIINIHPSLLPSFPGLNTHERAYETGVKYHGCTVHFVRAEVDAGPIITQEIIEVENKDSVETIAAKVLEKEHKAYKHAIKLIAEKRFTINGNRVETWD